MSFPRNYWSPPLWPPPPLIPPNAAWLEGFLGEDEKFGLLILLLKDRPPPVGDRLVPFDRSFPVFPPSFAPSYHFCVLLPLLLLSSHIYLPSISLFPPPSPLFPTPPPPLSFFYTLYSFLHFCSLSFFSVLAPHLSPFPLLHLPYPTPSGALPPHFLSVIILSPFPP